MIHLEVLTGETLEVFIKLIKLSNAWRRRYLRIYSDSAKISQANAKWLKKWRVSQTSCWNGQDDAIWDAISCFLQAIHKTIHPLLTDSI